MCYSRRLIVPSLALPPEGGPPSSVGTWPRRVLGGAGGEDGLVTQTPNGPTAAGWVGTAPDPPSGASAPGAKGCASFLWPPEGAVHPRRPSSRGQGPNRSWSSGLSPTDPSDAPRPSRGPRLPSSGLSGPEPQPPGQCSRGAAALCFLPQVALISENLYSCLDFVPKTNYSPESPVPCPPPFAGGTDQLGLGWALGSSHRGTGKKAPPPPGRPHMFGRRRGLQVTINPTGSSHAGAMGVAGAQGGWETPVTASLGLAGASVPTTPSVLMTAP